VEDIVERPWGTYQTILRGETYQVKRLVVYPGGQLSLQSHGHRSEHWIIVDGEGVATIGERRLEVAKDDSVYIPVGEKHRMSNFGEKNVVIIETQNGDYLGEDDIVRYEDIYGRLPI
ncbi:MAG: phosphomannose isomerase type II C-terminal cupin domain, partial [Rickettsiales bacterium]|jgi:mannose-6-phosphate isomerase-like protein (cupin superfamily)|nr:phosphomannose isomerase type II C-terminal cupin domain [Rickettsiales bacterium]